MANTGSENLFDALNLSLSPSEVEVGKTYPIYGRITRILSDIPGHVVAEVNNNLHLSMPIPSESGVELLRQRCFDWGIFVAQITESGETARGNCETVIFGRPGIAH